MTMRSRSLPILAWSVALATFLAGPAAVAQEAEDSAARKTDKAATSPAKGSPAPAKPTAQRPVQRVFEIKHVDSRNLAKSLQVFPAQIVPEPTLNTLSVSASPDIMTAIDATIARLDRPAPKPPSIEIIAQIIEGSQAEGTATPFPSDLEPVVRQLQQILSYKSYRLLDTLTLRTIKGGEKSLSPRMYVSGVGPVASPELPAPMKFTMAFNEASMPTGGRDRTVRLDGLSFTASVPLRFEPPVTSKSASIGPGYQYQDVTIHSDVDIPEGQKVVVGKAGVSGSGNALILVLTAKILG